MHTIIKFHIHAHSNILEPEAVTQEVKKITGTMQAFVDVTVSNCCVSFCIAVEVLEHKIMHNIFSDTELNITFREIQHSSHCWCKCCCCRRITCHHNHNIGGLLHLS